MMRKISVQSALAVTAFSACVVFAPVCAQDAEEPAAAAAEDGLPPPPSEAKPFTALFRCVRVNGVTQVLKPGASEWTKAEEGRFYPLGSAVRTVSEAGAPVSAEFSFGPEATIKLDGVAEAATRAIEIGERARTLELKSGRVLVNVPRTLKEGLFSAITGFRAWPPRTRCASVPRATTSSRGSAAKAVTARWCSTRA